MINEQVIYSRWILVINFHHFIICFYLCVADVPTWSIWHWIFPKRFNCETSVTSPTFLATCTAWRYACRKLFSWKDSWKEFTTICHPSKYCISSVRTISFHETHPTCMQCRWFKLLLLHRNCHSDASISRKSRLVTIRRLSISGKVGASFWWWDALLHQPVGIREETLESGNLFSGSAVRFSFSGTASVLIQLISYIYEQQFQPVTRCTP